MFIDKGLARQIPPTVAAAFQPKVRVARRDEFTLASQIRAASSHAERAAMVLRLTDDLVLHRGDKLKAACMDARFAPGAEYIELRIAATLAIRDRDGLVPERVLRPLEIWRQGLVAVAGGMSL